MKASTRQMILNISFLLIPCVLSSSDPSSDPSASSHVESRLPKSYRRSELETEVFKRQTDDDIRSFSVVRDLLRESINRNNQEQIQERFFGRAAGNIGGNLVDTVRNLLRGRNEDDFDNLTEEEKEIIREIRNRPLRFREEDAVDEDDEDEDDEDEEDGGRHRGRDGQPTRGRPGRQDRPDRPDRPASARGQPSDDWPDDRPSRGQDSHPGGSTRTRGSRGRDRPSSEISTPEPATQRPRGSRQIQIQEANMQDCDSTGFETKVREECKTVYDTYCETVDKVKYSNEIVPECETVVVQECDPSIKQVPKEKCVQKFEQKCEEKYEIVERKEYKEECNEVIEEVCHEELKISVPVKVPYPVPTPIPEYYKVKEEIKIPVPVKVPYPVPTPIPDYYDVKVPSPVPDYHHEVPSPVPDYHHEVPPPVPVPDYHPPAKVPVPSPALVTEHHAEILIPTPVPDYHKVQVKIPELKTPPPYREHTRRPRLYQAHDAVPDHPLDRHLDPHHPETYNDLLTTPKLTFDKLPHTTKLPTYHPTVRDEERSTLQPNIHPTDHLKANHLHPAAHPHLNHAHSAGHLKSDHLQPVGIASVNHAHLIGPKQANHPHPIGPLNENHHHPAGNPYIQNPHPASHPDLSKLLPTSLLQNPHPTSHPHPTGHPHIQNPHPTGHYPHPHTTIHPLPNHHPTGSPTTTVKSLPARHSQPTIKPIKKVTGHHVNEPHKSITAKHDYPFPPIVLHPTERADVTISPKRKPVPSAVPIFNPVTTTQPPRDYHGLFESVDLKFRPTPKSIQTHHSPPPANLNLHNFLAPDGNLKVVGATTLPSVRRTTPTQVHHSPPSKNLHLATPPPNTHFLQHPIQDVLPRSLRRKRSLSDGNQTVSQEGLKESLESLTLDELLVLIGTFSPESEKEPVEGTTDVDAKTDKNKVLGKSSSSSIIADKSKRLELLNHGKSDDILESDEELGSPKVNPKRQLHGTFGFKHLEHLVNPLQSFSSLKSVPDSQLSLHQLSQLNNLPPVTSDPLLIQQSELVLEAIKRLNLIENDDTTPPHKHGHHGQVGKTPFKFPQEHESTTTLTVHHVDKVHHTEDHHKLHHIKHPHSKYPTDHHSKHNLEKLISLLQHYHKPIPPALNSALKHSHDHQKPHHFNHHDHHKPHHIDHHDHKPPHPPGYGHPVHPHPEHYPPVVTKKEISAKPGCKAYSTKTCKKIPIVTPEKISIPSCYNIPKVDCFHVLKDVPDVHCHKKAVEDCREVVKEVPYFAPEEECRKEPREECVEIEEEVPIVVCTRVDPNRDPVVNSISNPYTG